MRCVDQLKLKKKKRKKKKPCYSFITESTGILDEI